MTINIFADALRGTSTCKKTENGANAFSTTENAIVDLFATIGAMRNGNNSMDRIKKMIDAAYAEDPLLLAKILFYARDVRGGLGERYVFREAIFYCADKYPGIVKKNIRLIPEYGRWDDMFALMGTSLEEDMWAVIISQLEEDTRNAELRKEISLCAKWMPSADTSSAQTRELAKVCARHLGMNTYTYKRYIRNLRKHLKLLETDMSKKNWKEIDYEAIPSQAHMRHVKAFYRNDEERYKGYIENVKAGKADIKASTLYPYEIVERLQRPGWDHNGHNDPYETMWKNLPDYVGEGDNILVIADTSGSMSGRPMATSVSLAIYFAERNKGAFEGMYMTFSQTPQIFQIDMTKSLAERYFAIYNGPWGGNTDLGRAMDLILHVAEHTHCRPEDMPKSIVVITDMEIDSCESEGSAMWNTIIDEKRKAFRAKGFELPNVVFWNVASRHDTYLARCNWKGVQLVSGSSASVFKSVLGYLNGMTPLDAVRKTLDVERYAPITI